MKTIFCKLSEIKKHKIVEEFPNPQIKKCVNKNGIVYRLHIIYPQDKIEIKPLTEKEALYYCGRKDNITMLHVNWFDTALIAGINENGRYSQNTELSKFTGYIDSVNTGSNGNCFLTEKVQNAIDILIQTGFEVDQKLFRKNSIITKWVKKLNKIGYPDARIYIDEDKVHISQGALLDKKHPNYRVINENQKEFENEISKKILKEYLT